VNVAGRAQSVGEVVYLTAPMTGTWHSRLRARLAGSRSGTAAPSGRSPGPSFAVLQRFEQIEAARLRLVSRGLMAADAQPNPIQSPDPNLRPDPIKTWDVELALEAIEASVARDDAILDMGSIGCAVLPALSQLGYRRLYGVDLDPRVLQMPFHDVIDYSIQDMNATNFDDASFSAITSISALEHGLHADALWHEVARLLRPGGVFLFSTDYWPEKIDTSTTPLFDLPWTIFDADEIVALVHGAADHGLRPVGGLERTMLAAGEKPIHFLDRDYTFLFGALTRAA
jgi:SAM-dependent methyltransferase